MIVNMSKWEAEAEHPMQEEIVAIREPDGDYRIGLKCRVPGSLRMVEEDGSTRESWVEISAKFKPLQAQEVVAALIELGVLTHR